MLWTGNVVSKTSGYAAVPASQFLVIYSFRIVDNTLPIIGMIDVSKKPQTAQEQEFWSCARYLHTAEVCEEGTKSSEALLKQLREGLIDFCAFKHLEISEGFDF